MCSLLLGLCSCRRAAQQALTSGQQPPQHLPSPRQRRASRGQPAAQQALTSGQQPPQHLPSPRRRRATRGQPAATQPQQAGGALPPAAAPWAGRWQAAVEQQQGAGAGEARQAASGSAADITAAAWAAGGRPQPWAAGGRSQAGSSGAAVPWSRPGRCRAAARQPAAVGTGVHAHVLAQPAAGQRGMAGWWRCWQRRWRR